MKIKQPLMRYHGGKFRMADWILGYFPPHRKYVEPFGGAASVLMQKPRSYAEVYNDLDSEIVNVFQVIRDRESCDCLIEALSLTPYSREEFKLAYLDGGDPVERARKTLFRAQAGFGSAGATKGTTGWRGDSDRDYGLASHHWAKYPGVISQFCNRLAGVVIENKLAVDVLAAHDTPNTLHFIDPPYLWGTRYKSKDKKRNGLTYRHEMNDEQHKELLDLVLDLRGMVIICGYSSDIYQKTFAQAGWKMRTKEARISSFRGTKLRTEVIWYNENCQDNQLQFSLDIAES